SGQFDRLSRWGIGWDGTTLVGFDVRSIDLHRDRLANQIHRQDESGALRILADQTSNNPPQRTAYHLDHRPFLYQRAGVVLKIAADQHTDAVQLEVGNGRRPSFKRHDIYDTSALEDRKGVGGIEAGEAVAGEERPVDLLLSILPAAPAGDRRQECLDALLLELLADNLLVTRARPDCEPRGRGGIVAHRETDRCIGCVRGRAQKQVPSPRVWVMSFGRSDTQWRMQNCQLRAEARI